MGQRRLSSGSSLCCRMFGVSLTSPYLSLDVWKFSWMVVFWTVLFCTWWILKGNSWNVGLRTRGHCGCGEHRRRPGKTWGAPLHLYVFLLHLHAQAMLCLGQMSLFRNGEMLTNKLVGQGEITSKVHPMSYFPEYYFTETLSLPIPEGRERNVFRGQFRKTRS